MKPTLTLLFLSLCFFSFAAAPVEPAISGQLTKGHKVTLSVAGPSTSEFDRKNPFLDYRLEVTFTHDKGSVTVPGFYAADGKASQTSAEVGNVWMVRFRPDHAGKWSYSVRFLEGKNIAVADDPSYGKPLEADGGKGSFSISEPEKPGPGFLGRGRIVNGGDGYLRFSDTGEYWIKNGADSPENFLAYSDFDQTYRYGEKSIIREGEANPKEKVHSYEPHITDWKQNDPVWQNGKGKGIIGAMNYLASKGVNSQYMLTMNIIGDGKDVWPYSDHNERYRFDCSKLDQWEIVFDHMEKLGIMLHFVLQETENECLLDQGFTGVQRKLYLRELAARFGHHPAVTWNMGEENGPADWSPIGQTDQQKKDMAAFLKKVNPYPSIVVVHTHSDDGKQDAYLTPLLGNKDLDGPSMQIGNVTRIHERIKTWVERSAAAGKPWVVCMDELGPAHKGVMPDSHDAKHDTVRQHALWGALMAGAAGVEWYFGYRYPHNDLMLEDFRSREIWWNQSTLATRFFAEYLPLAKMKPAANLLSGTKGYCLAQPGEVYAIYLPMKSAKAELLIEASGNFSVQWFNPRTGGKLTDGTLKTVKGGGKVSLGLPTDSPESDWVALIRKTK